MNMCHCSWYAFMDKFERTQRWAEMQRITNHSKNSQAGNRRASTGAVRSLGPPAVALARSHHGISGQTCYSHDRYIMYSYLQHVSVDLTCLCISGMNRVIYIGSRVNCSHIHPVPNNKTLCLVIHQHLPGM